MQSVLLTGLAKEFQKSSQKDKGGYSLRMAACRWVKRKLREKSIWPRVWWAGEGPWKIRKPALWS